VCVVMRHSCEVYESLESMFPKISINIIAMLELLYVDFIVYMY